MMRSLISVLALGGVAWAAVAAAPAPPPTDLKPIAPAAPNAPADADAAPRVTSFAPLTYFNQNCARCHGKYGSFYGDGFAKDLSDDSLHQVVAQMAQGPAQAPLSPADLEIETAWHRALRDGKPFVAIVKSEKVPQGWQLSGEVSPGATLEINGQPVEITKKSNWTALVAPGAVQLRAKNGEVVTELDAHIAALAP